MGGHTLYVISIVHVPLVIDPKQGIPSGRSRDSPLHSQHADAGRFKRTQTYRDHFVQMLLLQRPHAEGAAGPLTFWNRSGVTSALVTK